jgi:hypothetical protein
VATIGLSKAEIRRIVLRKLGVVYANWGSGTTGAGTRPGRRREDPRAFVVALVAALLGGLSEAMERNNRALAAAPAGSRRASSTTAASRPAPRHRPSRRR